MYVVTHVLSKEDVSGLKRGGGEGGEVNKGGGEEDKGEGERTGKAFSPNNWK